MGAILRIICVMILLHNSRAKTVSELCPRGWKYHEHTSTCFRLFMEPKTFSGAQNSCETIRGGPGGKEPGWLAGIHDKKTDKFVKYLLPRFMKAYIGLVYRDEGYMWLDAIRGNRKYTNFMSGFPLTFNKVSPQPAMVTIYDGWLTTLNSSEELAYVCEQFPAFPSPELTCEPAEEGKPSWLLSCNYPVDETVGRFVSSEVEHSGTIGSVRCLSRLRCRSGYRSISGQIFQTNIEKTLSTVVNVSRTITRTDSGSRWSCEYKFDKTRYAPLKDSCKMHVYTVARTFNCSYSFPRHGDVLVVCETSHAYPKPSTTWKHYIGKAQTAKLMPREMHMIRNINGQIFYDSKFEARITNVSQKEHKIVIFVVPSVTFTSENARFEATRTRTVKFTLTVPERSPDFFIESSLSITQNQHTVSEGQTVTLICKVGRAIPPVSTTVIRCDNTVRDCLGNHSWSADSQQMKIQLTVTDAMDQRVCTCSAEHVSNQYQKQTSVTFNILHVARIVRFFVNQRTDDPLEMSEGENITFACTAHGNPTPQLQLYQIDDDGRISKTLNDSVGTSLSSSIDHAFCNSSGTYVCAAKNKISLETSTSERRVAIKVRCQPQPCTERDSEREFAVLTGTEAVITICVMAYPQPHYDIRIRPRGGRDFGTDLYSAGFIHVDSLHSKIYVQINMSSAITQPGNYTLALRQLERWSDIDFSLVPLSPPSCPDSLDIKRVGGSSATLSWVPAADSGLPQTFTLSQVDDEGVAVENEEIEGIGGSLVLYNISNIDPHSGYRFKLSVRNGRGVVECPDLETGLSAPASVVRSRDSSWGLFIGVLVLIGVVIVDALLVVAVITLTVRYRHTRIRQICCLQLAAK